MVQSPYIEFVTLIGSLRPDSFDRAIANTLDELAPEDVQVNLLGSVGDLPHYSGDVCVTGFPFPVIAMAQAIAAADAIIIVTPEYAGSMPGALKNALDWLGDASLRPFAGKPVAIETASAGPLGGARCQSHLRETLASLNAVVLNRPEIMVADVADKVNPQTVSLSNQETRAYIASQLTALAALVHERRRLL